MTTTKEKIINQAITEVTKKINHLEYELFHNDPISKQIELHGKFSEFLRDTKGSDRLTSKSFKFIKDLNKEMEKHQERQKTYDTNKIQKELLKLGGELRDLHKEKFYTNARKK
jgi:hypothetical protein